MIVCQDMRTKELAGGFVAYLNDRWPTGGVVTLVVAPDDYYSVVANGKYGFGVYARDADVVYICVISPAPWASILLTNGESADGAEREFLWTIAHEFAHHLQVEGNEALSQESADTFAEKAVDGYLGSRRNLLM